MAVTFTCGHPYSRDNTTPRGECRECQRAYKRARREVSESGWPCEIGKSVERGSYDLLVAIHRALVERERRVARG